MYTFIWDRVQYTLWVTFGVPAPFASMQGSIMADRASKNCSMNR